MDNPISLTGVETLCPVSTDQIQNTLLRKCLEHWEDLRADKKAPDYNEIDLLTFPLSLIPACSVVEISPVDQTMRYRFWGSSLTRFTQMDMTGEAIEDMPINIDGNAVYNQFDLIKNQIKPGLFIMQLIASNGHEATETVIRLPLSKDNTNVDSILSFSDMGDNPFLYPENKNYTVIG